MKICGAIPPPGNARFTTRTVRTPGASGAGCDSGAESSSAMSSSLAEWSPYPPVRSTAPTEGLLSGELHRPEGPVDGGRPAGGAALQPRESEFARCDPPPRRWSICWRSGEGGLVLRSLRQRRSRFRAPHCARVLEFQMFRAMLLASADVRAYALPQARAVRCRR